MAVLRAPRLEERFIEIPPMIEGYRVVTEVTGKIEARGASDSGQNGND